MEDVPGYLSVGKTSIQGRKKSMDDALVAVVVKDTKMRGRNGETTGMFGLFNGYAGPNAALFLKDHFFEHLQKLPEYSTNLEEALCQNANWGREEIHEVWHHTGVKNCASVCAAVFRDGHLYVLNLGQTRAILCRAEGEMEVVSDPSARIGESTMKPVVNVVGLDCEDEFLLLGCSGFFSKINESQALKLARTSLKKYKDPDAVAQKMAYSAYVNGAAGNITIMIILINSELAFAGHNPGRRGLFRRGEAGDDKSDGSGTSSSFSSTATPTKHKPSVFIGKGVAMSPVHRIKNNSANNASSNSKTSSARDSPRASGGIPAGHDGIGAGKAAGFEWDVDQMKEEMERLVAAQEFERAARLRDRIKLVEHMNDLIKAMEFEAAANIRDQLIQMG